MDARSAVPTPEPDDPERMAQWPTGRILSTAARLLEHAWFEELERLGLSYAGLTVLHLLEGGALIQTELARRARVENQTMSRTLARLERQGYVRREPDPGDRRRHLVSRTDGGTRAWNEAKSVEADLFPEVDDLDGFRSTLLDIVATVEKARWSSDRA